MSEESQLKKAREFLSKKDYVKAWNVLIDIPDNPMARTWMNKLIGSKTQLAARPAKNTEAALKKACQHIADKDFADAWGILSAIPDDMTARKWMRQLLSKSEIDLAASSGGGSSGGRRILLLLVGIIVIVAVIGAALFLQQRDGDDNGGGDAPQTASLPQAQAVSRADGTLTVRYPEGWVARQEDDTVLFGSSEAAMNAVNENTPPAAGEVAGQVVQLFTPEIVASLGVGESPAPVDVLNAFTVFLTEGGDPQFTLQEPEAFTANGRNGALVAGTVTDGEQSFDALIMVIEEGDVVPVIVMGSASGQIEQHKARAQEIAGAIEFVPAGSEDNATEEATEDRQDNPTEEPASSADSNLPQSITAQRESGSLTISYPEGWAANVDEFGTITLANSAEVLALAGNAAAEPAAGQILGTVIEVVSPDMLGVMGMGTTPLEVATNFSQIMATQGGEGTAMTSGEPQAFTAGGKDGALLTGTITEEGRTLDSVVIVVQEGDSLIILVFAALEGETAQFTEQMQAIAGSVDLIVNEETSALPSALGTDDGFTLTVTAVAELNATQFAFLEATQNAPDVTVAAQPSGNTSAAGANSLTSATNLGTVTVTLPEGWFGSSDLGLMFISNNEAALFDDESSFNLDEAPPGLIIGVVSPQTTVANLGERSLEQLMLEISLPGLTIVSSEIQQVNGKEVFLATTTGNSIPFQCIQCVLRYVYVNEGDGVVGFVYGTSPGETDVYLDEILSIAASVEFEPSGI